MIFFFKQKTAYEMRISDWSSDVCSSDLLGFTDPPAIAAMIRGWHFGRYRAMRSERAREKLTAIMPQLLDAFAHTGSPDVAIRRFDQFLSSLPAGVQLFALLQANPGVLDTLAELQIGRAHGCTPVT